MGRAQAAAGLTLAMSLGLGTVGCTGPTESGWQNVPLPLWTGQPIASANLDLPAEFEQCAVDHSAAVIGPNVRLGAEPAVPAAPSTS